MYGLCFFVFTGYISRNGLWAKWKRSNNNSIVYLICYKWETLCAVYFVLYNCCIVGFADFYVKDKRAKDMCDKSQQITQMFHLYNLRCITKMYSKYIISQFFPTEL